MFLRRALPLLLLAACPPNNGIQTPGCTSNADCAGSQPVCVRSEANGGHYFCGCNTDVDCHGGKCSYNSCVACKTNADCDPGLLCSPDGGCTGCASDADCGDGGLACHLGVCGVSCDVELDGGYAGRVLAALADVGAAGDAGQLIVNGFAGYGWTSSGEQIGCGGQLSPLFYLCIPCNGCAAGQSCIAGDCSCKTNLDCLSSGLVCGASGFCSACGSDSDCGCGRACTLGLCHAACQSDADCQALDAGLNRCAPGGNCAPCLTDADCDGGARCYEDGCVVPCQGCQYSCTDGGRCPGCDIYAAGPFPEGSVTACAPDGGSDAGADGGADAGDGG